MIEAIMNRIVIENQRTEANRRGHVVSELTALSFLIDRNIATVEEVIQRIGEVPKTLAGAYLEQDVTERTNLLVEALRAVYGPKPSGWRPVVIEGGKNQDQGGDPSH